MEAVAKIAKDLSGTLNPGLRIKVDIWLFSMKLNY